VVYSNGFQWLIGVFIYLGQYKIGFNKLRIVLNGILKIFLSSSVIVQRVIPKAVIVCFNGVL
jgi:hypothetical protein